MLPLAHQNGQAVRTRKRSASFVRYNIQASPTAGVPGSHDADPALTTLKSLEPTLPNMVACRDAVPSQLPGAAPTRCTSWIRTRTIASASASRSSAGSGGDLQAITGEVARTFKPNRRVADQMSLIASFFSIVSTRASCYVCFPPIAAIYRQGGNGRRPVTIP